MEAEHRQQAVTALTAMIHEWWTVAGAAAPMLFAQRISLAALRRVGSADLLRASGGVRLKPSRSGPEQCECGSGCAIRSTGSA
jgi:hypothetical protein